MKAVILKNESVSINVMDRAETVESDPFSVRIPCRKLFHVVESFRGIARTATACHVLNLLSTKDLLLLRYNPARP